MMELTVTADHRILDGADVARFVRTLQETVKGLESREEAKLVFETVRQLLVSTLKLGEERTDESA